MTTIKTWNDTSVLRIAPPADAGAEATVWHPTIRRFGVRFRRNRHGAFGTGTYTAVYWQGGRDHPISIGKVGAITLDVARAEAQKIFAAVAQKLNPRIERDKADAAHNDVFKACVGTYLEHLAAGSRSPRYIAITERYLTRYFPDLRELPLQLITRRQCADALRRLLKPGPGWTGGTATYTQGAAALAAYFQWLLLEGRADVNPAARPRRYKNKPRDRVLSETELRAVWNAIDGATPRTVRLLKLLVLTGARREQIGQLRKDWVDLDGAIPTIRLPGGERGGSKNGELFVVPLARQAVAILREQLQEAPADTDYVFGQAGAKRGFASFDKAVVALRERTGVEGWSLHDLRRTFVTIALDKLALDPMLLDACINHTPGFKRGVSGIYQRSTLVAARVPVVQAWADYCNTLTDTAPKLRLVT